MAVRPKRSRASVLPAARGAKRTSSKPTLVVGVGGSAGSLEALQQFLHGIPADSGAAFVVVTHLDPRQKGLLPELLARSTALRVCKARSGAPVLANEVHVLPPDHDLALRAGKLVLQRRQSGPVRLPIDHFFRSLAADVQDRAAGIILSGMGADGTVGMRAIKEAGGVALVQAPETAAFDAMPRAVITAGLADVVAAPAELAATVLSLAHEPHERGGGQTAAERGSLEEVTALLHQRTGQDFSQYKPATVMRRVERRLQVHRLAGLAAYVEFLRRNPAELDRLFRELLIGVTSFFRDPEVWEALRRDVLPGVLRGCPAGAPFRAWVAGCSTGEEAYSLAMIVREAMHDEKQTRVPVQIYATDLDREAVERGRKGLYPPSMAADVGPARLKRFFTRDEHGWRVSPELREMVIFAPQNIIGDPPFTRLDVLSCRNVLIYLSAEVQKKLLPVFAHALNPGGILVLGTSESVSATHGSFEPVSEKWKIFRRAPGAVDGARAGFPVSRLHRAGATSAAWVAPGPEPLGAGLVERFIARRVAPLTLLVTPQGELLYASQRTGRYLEPPAGAATGNVLDLAREGLRRPLAAAMRKAARSRVPCRVAGVRVLTSAGLERVDLNVRPVLEHGTLHGNLLVSLDPARPSAAAGRRGAPDAEAERSLEAELRAAREQAEELLDSMNASREELRSSNEELQSTNEELQSANEELMTSKEEMQSMNEELLSLNAELQAKNEELALANDDMRNLLDSTQIPTLFLDNALCLKRFTSTATRVANLRPADVGRPITDLNLSVRYADLESDVREVLRTLVFKEVRVTGRDGTRYSMRIHPYRTMNNVIDGVVVAFVELGA